MLTGTSFKCRILGLHASTLACPPRKPDTTKYSTEEVAEAEAEEAEVCLSTHKALESGIVVCTVR